MENLVNILAFLGPVLLLTSLCAGERFLGDPDELNPKHWYYTSSPITQIDVWREACSTAQKKCFTVEETTFFYLGSVVEDNDVLLLKEYIAGPLCHLDQAEDITLCRILKCFGHEDKISWLSAIRSGTNLTPEEYSHIFNLGLEELKREVIEEVGAKYTHEACELLKKFADEGDPKAREIIVDRLIRIIPTRDDFGYSIEKSYLTNKQINDIEEVHNKLNELAAAGWKEAQSYIVSGQVHGFYFFERDLEKVKEYAEAGWESAQAYGLYFNGSSAMDRQKFSKNFVDLRAFSIELGRDKSAVEFYLKTLPLRDKVSFLLYLHSLNLDAKHANEGNAG